MLWAQKANNSQYDITLNGKKIENAANFSKVKESLKARYGTKSQEKIGVFILQFNNIPTSKEKEALKTQGIELLGYVHGNAYYAKLSAKLLAADAKSQSNLRAIYDIKPDYKIDPEITQEIIPDYAIVGNGVVKVVVSFFRGTEVALINSDLATVSAKSNRISKVFSQVTIDIPLKNILELAKKEWVQNIQFPEPPADFENRPGRTMSRSNVLNSKISGLGYGLTGKGVKMGIWDGNVEPHKDFGSRLNTREYESVSSHGSHTTGSIASAGVLDPWARGMAPEVDIYSWNFNTQSNGLPVYEERYICANEDGIEITSNSYGVNVTACPSTTKYGTGDQGDDLVTTQIPYLLNVYSNGNNQNRCTGGFNTSSKNSKNALHVAAIDAMSNMSSFSSFGPTIDGRLVPQVSNFGVGVWSTSYNNGYESMDGTSMATPTTTGTAVLLIEAFKKKFNNRPLASLLKAIISNTARDLGNIGPDYKFGYGEVNGLRAMEAIEKNHFFTGTVEHGQNITKDITIPAGAKAVNVMIAWSDEAAVPGVGKILTNNIDLKVTKSSTNYLPWILDPLNPANLAGKGIDNINNMEQVTIDNPSEGTYTLVIEGKNIPDGPQEFSVTYDIIYPILRLTYPIGDEIINPGYTEVIRWESYGYTDTYDLQYSLDGGATYINIAENIPATVRSYAWIVPAAASSNVKVRIISGSKLSESKVAFTIMAAPVLSISGSDVVWTAIPNAKYEVFKLNGENNWDLIQEVTTNSYSVSSVTPGEEHFIAVKAVDLTSGAKSERSVAIKVIPCLALSQFPILENFNQFNSYKVKFNFDINYGVSTVSRFSSTEGFAALQGYSSGTTFPSSWIASTTANAFTNNPSYIKSMSICGVDATSLAGQKLRIAFDMTLGNSLGNGSFFRLLVNGTPIANSAGTTVYGTTVSAFTKVYYDLTAYAGTSFSLTWQAVSVFTSDITRIDNIQLGVPVIDAALTSLTPNTGLTATETVTIKVRNLSGDPISNVPLSYKINDGAVVEEVIAGPIAPLEEVTYNFTQMADYSVTGSYTVVAAVSLASDAVASNNSITKTVVNTGPVSGIVMGVSASPQTTCDAYLYDNGGVQGNYTDNATNTMRINPSTPNSNVKVTFEAFDLEYNWDFLEIYNGIDATAPLIARLTGTTLPASYTSSADGGQLFFRFTSDVVTNAAGFVAKLSCEPKPANDAGAVSISTPPYIVGKRSNAEVIKVIVKNYGTNALTNLEVFYQINGESKVVETVASLASLATTTVTFATTADLSNNIAYTLKAGINQPDDNNANNELTRELKAITPFNHTNTDSYGILKLALNGVEKSSGVTPYSDFKTVEFSAYKGVTYSPQIFTNIPQQPISRDVGTANGSFSLIIIDLNGNGDLADEFASGTFWVNTLTTSTAPYISTKTMHFFRHNFTLALGMTIPTTATNGKQLMRVINMYRRPSEGFNPYLGPTYDGATTSSSDFEVEDYTIDIQTQPTGDVGISAITPIRPARETNSTITATIRNYSSVAINNFDVAYTINSGAEVVQTHTTSIAANGTGTITFTTTADLKTLGTTYNIEVYTKLTADQLPANDKMTTTVTTPTLAINNVVGTWNDNTLAAANAIPSMDLTNNYSFEFWVNPSRPTAFGRIFDKTNVAIFYQASPIYSTVYPENTYILNVTTATASFTYYYPGTVTPGKWQHIALTVSSSNVYKFYIDGVEQTPILYTGTVGATKTNATIPLYLGNNAALTRGVTGQIDEVRVWNSELSQATIANNMSTDYPANTAGMIAYYKFKEGNGNFIYDYSSNDNTAIITGVDVSGVGDGKFWNIPVLNPRFFFDEQIGNASFDTNTKTYSFIVNSSANASSLAAKFNDKYGMALEITGTPQVSGITNNDFTTPKTYTVNGVGINAGLQEQYTVQVAVDGTAQYNLLSYGFTTANNPQLSSDINLVIDGSKAYAKVPYGTNLNALKASFTASSGAQVLVGGVAQISPQASSMDYTQPIALKVVASNTVNYKFYEVFVDARNTVAAFTAFSVPDQVGSTVIDANNKTVQVFVKNYASFANIVPTFLTSPNAKPRINSILQQSGSSAQDFTQPVNYIIESEDGATFNTWTVTIENDVTKPVITLVGNATVEMTYGTNYTDAGATATDNVDGTITSSIVVTGLPTNTSPVGAYTVRYNITDAAGNTATEVTRTVNVVKATATITITNTTQQNTGVPKAVTTATTPAGLTVDVTYTGSGTTTYATSATAPTNTGTYAVVATINDANYTGSNTATLTITPGTGVDPNDMNNVRIYTNSTIVFVEIPELKGSVKLSIYNIIGKQVYRNDNLTQGVNRIDENFIAGTYIVKVMVGNEVTTEKVVIQK